MSDNDELFSNTTADPADNSNTPDIQEPMFSLPDSAKTYIGPDKKYKDIDHALGSIAPSQEHIRRLEEENAALRESVNKAKSVEDVLKEIKATQGSTGVTPPQNQLDPATLQKMVLDTVHSLNDENQKRQNVVNVTKEMETRFGSEAKKAMLDKASELGVDSTYMQQLAEQNPSVFLAMFPAVQQKPSTKATSGSVDPGSFNSSQNTATKKTIMRGATSKDIVDEWRRCGELVKGSN